MSVKILLADDHDIVRQGIRLYLQFDPEMEIVGEASDGQEAIRLARQLRPDVILMDILMPVIDGLKATELIKKDLPETEVVILTSVIDESVIQRSIKAGASGYLLKDTRSEELCKAIRAAADGQIQLSRKVAAQLAAGQEASQPLESLTDREEAIINLIQDGLSNKEIALQLSIKEKTVKNHVTKILAKYNVSSRTQLVIKISHSASVLPN